MMIGPDEDIEIRLLLDAIYHRFHYDFRSYSMASIRRRLAQARAQLGCETTSRLQERVLHDPQTFPRLLQFLTGQVSVPFPDLSLKVWVAGCSTGEEVYSLAIAFREEGILDRTTFYATDITPDALRKAEAAVYPLERIPTFTENHRLSGAPTSLSEHYTAAYGSAVLDRSLRKQIVFSDHSLATDSVFAEVQLVTCRNVLIYFDKALQDRALGLMRDSLCRRGFLGLGTKETLRFSSHATAFRQPSLAEQWYQRC